MEKERTKCLIYTRVMWYLSPTYRYNIGKKSEFYWRKYFSKDKAANHDFNINYGSSCGSLEFINWTEQVQNIIMKNKDFVEQYT